MYFSNLFGITSAHKELNDCHDLLNYEILQGLFQLIEVNLTTLNFPVDVTVISSFFIAIINEFFTYLTRTTRLKSFFFFTHNRIFVKIFFHYLFTISILFKNCFNKFVSCIFTSKNNYWLGKFIINTIRTFITFNPL